ncbi:hypothetical protein ABZ892_12685 [Streptomyces sp. NPDC046924]
MHHPLTTPARHALYHRLAARNRIWIAYRKLPAPPHGWLTAVH